MDVLTETTEKLNETLKAHIVKNKLFGKILNGMVLVLSITGLILIFVRLGTSSSSSSSTSALQSNPISITLNDPVEDETQDIFPASTNPNSKLEILKARLRGRGRRRSGSVSVVFVIGILVLGLGWGLVACFGCCFNPCRAGQIILKYNRIVKESNDKRKTNT